MRSFWIVGAPVLFLASSGAALATDRYVDCTNGNDSYPGTMAQPWRTLQKASDSSGSLDVVHVTAGPCPINMLSIGSNLNGSTTGDCRTNNAACTIIKGDPSTVDVVPSMNGVDGIYLSGATGALKNIKLENLNLRSNAGNVFDDAIKTVNGGMSRVVLKNVIVQGTHGRGVFIAGGSVGTQEVLLDNLTVTSTVGFGVRIISERRCSGNQAVCGGPTDPDCGAQGPCTIGPVHDIKFQRGTIGGNTGSDGLVTGSSSASSQHNSRVYDITLDETFIENNGDDGLDIAADFANTPSQFARILNVESQGNAKAGMRFWHSAQVENSQAVNNAQSGVHTARVSGDTSIAKTYLINVTSANNSSQGGTQINLDRTQYAQVKIYNTIGSSDQSPFPVALKYTKGTQFSIDWDYDVFHRTLAPGCSTGSCTYVIEYDSNGCPATQVPTCDGSHPNSQGAKPLFVSSGLLAHLQSTSPGFDGGKKPSTIAGLSGISILAADTRDEDAQARPQNNEYDVGAYEGAFTGGGC
jgi:hypothetical protein